MGIRKTCKKWLLLHASIRNCRLMAQRMKNNAQRRYWGACIYQTERNVFEYKDGKDKKSNQLLGFDNLQVAKSNL